MAGMKRREFLASAAAAAAAGQVLGANDRLVVGLIGCGLRGSYVASKMREASNVEFGAVCDVYEPNAAKAHQWAGAKAKQYADFRKLLENKDIDAVMVSTPDHWHSAIAIMACEAGKDVYVEKPLTHNVREGRAMVNAARRYKRIVQAGMQHRSAPHYAEVAKLVQSGAIGDVRFVRVWNYNNRTVTAVPDGPAPTGLDWDMYLGPAPEAPFNNRRFLGTFRMFRDYSGGFITDFGTHRLDSVHQIMGAEIPRTVSAAGGRFNTKAAGDVYDLMQVTYEYPGWVLSYECTFLNGHGLGGRRPGMKYYNALGDEDRPHGEAFYGSLGTIFTDRIGYEVFPEKGSKLDSRFVNTTDATGLHAAAFVEAVRTRKTPPGEVETGHRSTTIPLIGNIALDTGRKLTWDGVKEEFVGDEAANRRLGREARKKWDLVPGSSRG